MQLIVIVRGIQDEVHAILYAHLIPSVLTPDLFGRLGRASGPPDNPCPTMSAPQDERHIRELDRLNNELEVLDREVAEGALRRGDQPAADNHGR